MAKNDDFKKLLDEPKNVVHHIIEPEKSLEPSQSSSNCNHEDLLSIFDSMDFMLFIIDNNGFILKTNSFACRFLGYTPDELKGKNILDIHPQELRENAASIFSDMLSGKGTSCPIPLLTKKGRRIPVETRGTRCVWEGVEIIFGISRDISDRISVQEALRASEARYRFLAEKINDIIWTVDLDLHVTYISPSVEKLVGFTPAECMLLEPWEAITPESYARILDIMGKEFQREKEEGIDPERIVKFEMENIHKNGTTLWVECVVSTIRDNTGKVVGFYGVSRDISDRKKSEEVQRTAEIKYKRLYESMMDAFVTTDISGYIKEFNELYLTMLGYTADEITTFTFRDLTPEKWHAMQEEIIKEQVLKRGYSDIYEKEYRRKDGTVFPIEARAFLIKDDRGDPSGMWAIVRDITDRKRLENEMKKHQNQLESLVKERTAKLEHAVNSLKQEIKERKRTEYALRSRESELKMTQCDLEEMNTALKVMIKQAGEDKEQTEQNIISNIKSSVLPYLDKLKDTGLRGDQIRYCSEVESHLKEICSLFIKKLSSDYIGLSPTQIQVASLIREGKSSKEIAQILNISVYTVTSHRYHIRKKIDMRGKISNLRSYLLTLE